MILDELIINTIAWYRVLTDRDYDAIFLFRNIRALFDRITPTNTTLYLRATHYFSSSFCQRAV